MKRIWNRWQTAKRKQVRRNYLVCLIRLTVGRSRTQVRILDTATRARRQKRQLEALEKDNFQEDPHAAFAHLVKSVKLPSFHDGTECNITSLNHEY